VANHVLQANDLVVERRPVAPPITIIPEQNLQAIGFSPTRRGPLDLVSDPPRDPFDPEQTSLYQRIRSQLKQLKETIPSQERTQIDAALDDFLDQPENWHEVEFKKVLWLCGNSIRTVLTQHDAVKDDPEPTIPSFHRPLPKRSVGLSKVGMYSCRLIRIWRSSMPTGWDLKNKPKF
jgi:hypothetical protein